MTWLYIWLGVTVVTLVVEFVTFELVSVWLSVGSFIAMILAACRVPLEVQIVVMVVVSVLCIIFLRKISLKWLNKTNEKTNIDTVVGKKVKLLTKITADEMGTVKINGVTYSAKALSDIEINENEYVIIEKVEGNKLIVKKEN